MTQVFLLPVDIEPHLHKDEFDLQEFFFQILGFELNFERKLFDLAYFYAEFEAHHIVLDFFGWKLFPVHWP